MEVLSDEKYSKCGRSVQFRKIQKLRCRNHQKVEKLQVRDPASGQGAGSPILPSQTRHLENSGLAAANIEDRRIFRVSSSLTQKKKILVSSRVAPQGAASGKYFRVKPDTQAWQRQTSKNPECQSLNLEIFPPGDGRQLWYSSVKQSGSSQDLY